ncbi:MAG: bifunctional (p)ppGpp synthetase/guanosine-3',5'-bis(diphosphate) 3'-pyrophosphohydrolase [Chloroflexi bacterium]|nr:bifunctional (p)ppGpp synthetase/guanosine-3',5'-bis(diphosphate) 3'-pyrophosphohydrolase [Chloroflexota bacterium]
MRIEQLLERLPSYYTVADRALVERAYRVAEKAHEGQKRASGEPYIQHCLAVADILAELRMPPAVVAAGLLHDTVEDTDVTLDDLRRDFGDEVASLVDGVTKLVSLPRVSRADQAQAEDGEAEDEAEELSPQSEWERKRKLANESLRKTFLAMSRDIRVVIIKLADRLHNMRTLASLPPEKQRRIAQQTLDIFAPLANRLGIWQIKWELEDLAFRYVNPEAYKDIARKLAERRTERERELERVSERIRQVLAEAGIRAKIYGRPKHIYSIYRKMQRKGVPFESLRDIRGVRIIVDDIPTCYTVLGVVHTRWKPIPGEFDDYIANPKDNSYQSLHTAVLFEDGKILEIQIRTQEMHQRAEYGIAAHWRYKEGDGKFDEDFERKINWLRQLMEWQQDVSDAGEFVDGMKTDVFGDRIYVFTPRGDIIDLPAGATPIDFAYHIHTEIGHRCRGAKVNGKLVPLSYKLKTGDQVEILTARRGGPSRDWLNPNLELVKTQRAKAKIRQWFKKQAREQNLAHGKAVLEREFKRLGLEHVNLEPLAKYFDYRSVDDLYVAVGCGDLSLNRIINRLAEVDQAKQAFHLSAKPTRPVETGDEVTIMGLKGMLIHRAKCCNPAPGDPIVGYITRGRGATIHRQDCPNILRVQDKGRLVQVSWGVPTQAYAVPVRVRAYDREGLMKDVAVAIADEGVNIEKVQVKVSDKTGQAIIDLVLSVRDIAQLSRVLTRLESLPNVLEAFRYRPG